MGVGTNGFPLKKPPDSYTGTDDNWRSLSQSQRRRIRKGPVIREKERAYRNRPDIKADIKEYRLRPEVKAAAYVAYLRSKERKRVVRMEQPTIYQDATATNAVAVDAIVISDATLATLTTVASQTIDGVE